MTEVNNVPDWAYERMRGFIANESVLSAFARYIAAHEKPPVDPDLLIAREASADIWGDNDDERAITMTGKYDDSEAVGSALRAIKLYRERNQ